ncbi:MAG: ribonuclease Z [Planctomycetes bacterium ADurb.Bin126]|nr:MAG: ribonuclease Z [Planctomycetes bacterium ADurb.Bin126]HOD80000.1 MBL fold metallo-hydrolase [Phycisphaerae bacterium]HQL73089.1 MBL fold metallo-hydrolase [Phycisphaerae bacterium]
MFLSTSGGGAGTFSSRRFVLRIAVAAALGALPAARALAERAPPSSLAPQQGKFVSLAEQAGVELLVWQDICNVYVLREGEAALLIDIGDGSVLDHLGEIGVKQVEWVLVTHHHREQVQGHPRLAAFKPKLACGQLERQLLEKPMDFRLARPSLGDRYTVYGPSYVRPPVEPLKVDQAFAPRDSFTWRGREFWCVQTAGDSPGGMSYLLQTPRGWLAFSGDVYTHPGRMHSFQALDWDYGFAKGLYALVASVNLLENVDPALLLPSHGPVAVRPIESLRAYGQTLRTLTRLLVRGYTIFTFGDADTDNTSRPGPIPHLWRITPHLYKFRGPNHGPNFTILLADSGRAMLVDCGIGEKEIDTLVEQMRQKMGLKSIDMAWITHMHGDHTNGGPYIRDKYGTKLWTLDRLAGPVEQPERFDYSAQPWSYSPKVGPIPMDRKFKPGEKVKWEGYEFTCDWMPGQTEFGCCIHARIDGRLVAWTGDNLFGNPADEAQDGHEALVAHNSAILEEGYIYGSHYLRKLQPDLILGGHSFVMDKPAGMIERYCKWSLAMREAFRGVSADDDYRYMFDPYWVRPDPYRLTLAPGASGELTLHVRNFLEKPGTFKIRLHLPAGLTAEPAVLEGTTPAAPATADGLAPPVATASATVKLTAAGDLKSGTRLMIAFDVTRDGKRYGEWFDCIVIIK